MSDFGPGYEHDHKPSVSLTCKICGDFMPTDNIERVEEFLKLLKESVFSAETWLKCKDSND